MIENETSTTKEILTGVPQVSVFDPLLFLIYVNDILEKISKTHYFTDDTSIMQSNKSLEFLAKQLNKDLLNFSYWLRTNKLPLNV